jgi:hypothetical protein
MALFLEITGAFRRAASGKESSSAYSADYYFCAPAQQ